MANGEIPVDLIYENKNFFSIFDINPLVDKHCLIISKKHFDTFLDIPFELGAELLDCINKTAIKIIEDGNFEGFNILNNNSEVAGQVIKHVHFHLFPRKEGDNFKLPG